MYKENSGRKDSLYQYHIICEEREVGTYEEKFSPSEVST